MAFQLQLDPYQPQLQQLPQNVDSMAALLAQQEQNKPVQEQLTQDIIKDNLLNGLNYGNKQAAQWIQENNIRTPQTEAEKEQSYLGNFNQPELLQTGVSEKPRFWNEFLAGYKDNYENPISSRNLAPDNTKTWQNRLGEGLGTAMRFVDSPLGRGLLAGGLMALGGGSAPLAAGIGFGVGANYQNNQTADKLYRNQLKQYGYTDDDLAGINGFINNDTYKNLSNNLYRNRQIGSRLAIASAKDKTSKAKLIMDGFKNGTLTEQDALNELALNGISLSDLNESNQTKSTNSQVGLNSAKTIKTLKEADYVGKPKTTISIRKGGTRSIVDINHNGGGGNNSPSGKPTKASSGHKTNAF